MNRDYYFEIQVNGKHCPDAELVGVIDNGFGDEPSIMPFDLVMLKVIMDYLQKQFPNGWKIVGNKIIGA